MPRLGSISQKSMSHPKVKALASKLAVLSKTRAQRGRMTTFDHKGKDEGNTGQAAFNRRQIDQASMQAKKGVGTVSKGGGIGKAESNVTAEHIDQPENKKIWPYGGDVKKSNPATGNTRMKGPIPKSGGLYGGGGQSTQ